MRVGFVGLGSMGGPMAENVLKGGFELLVYNRTKEKAMPLTRAGAHLMGSVKELAASSDILVSMVSNDEALLEIVEGASGLFSSGKKPSIHISMSTISPTLSETLEKRHQEQGIDFLAAPVSGRPERAQAGKLWIFLAGAPQAKEKASPVLQTMGCQIYDLGEKPAAASLFKLCNNFMVLSLIESFAETAAMLEKAGITTEKAAQIWGSSLFDAPIFHSYMPVICKKSFDQGGFALDLGLKDMRLLQTAADRAEVPMPILSELHDKLIESLHLGRAKWDWSAISLLAKERAGL